MLLNKTEKCLLVDNANEIETSFMKQLLIRHLKLYRFSHIRIKQKITLISIKNIYTTYHNLVMPRLY